MFFEGDVPAVLKAMAEKKKLIESGKDAEGPRILLIGCGGVMYGCEAGGVVTAFYENGYGEVFDWVLGLSTSAPGVGYFLSGKPRIGTTIYSEECCTKDFISLRRLSVPVDTGYLDGVIQNKTGKGLNPERIFAHRTQLLIGSPTLSVANKSLLCRAQPMNYTELCMHL